MDSKKKEKKEQKNKIHVKGVEEKVYKKSYHGLMIDRERESNNESTKIFAK